MWHKTRRQEKKSFIRLLSVLLAVLLGLMTACTNRSTVQSQKDVLTQKEIPDGRTPVTVLVKNAFTIHTFERAVEEKFPNIDLIQVGNHTRDMGIAEYESRLANDDLTDIIMSWPLDIGEEYWEDRLMDLSGFDFTSKYNLSMLNTISKDGKLYYLPGPSQVRGIIYNKTLFEEKGWKVPDNYSGFLALCQEIEASGMRSLQLGLGNAEVLDTAFVGYSYADCYSQPQDTKWIENYNEGQYSFGDHFGSALDTFQQLIDKGILQENDLNITYADRERMLFTRQCAMIEDSVLMTRMGGILTGTTDEFALMPFFNPNDGQDWARLYMVCYVGLNKHLAEPENKEQYKLVMELMEYISTPEGQEAMMGDTGAMFSSLMGVAPSSVPESELLVPALENGRYAIFPELKNAQAALREGLAGMVRGEKSKADVIQMVDEQNASPPEVQPPDVVGTADADFSLMETGNFIADCMRKAADTEIALFLDNGKDGRQNGKGVSGSLYQGEITETDINRILPDMKRGEKGVLCKVTMSGAALLDTLEYSISVDNNQTGWFYYFSGLQMEYNPVAEPGSRIRSITTKDGKEIDKEKIYSLAVMDATVDEQLLQSHEETETTIASVLINAMQEQKTISPSRDGRFVILGGTGK